MDSIPPLTKKLLWAALGSLVISMMPVALLARLMLWPFPGFADGTDLGTMGNFMPWQLVTHLLVNPGTQMIFVALTLYFFGGSMLETTWGARRYGLFLLACAAGSALLQFAVSTLAFSTGLMGYAPIYGADGVMYGILFACAYLYPTQEVRLLIPPILLKMQTLVIVLCALSFGIGVWQGGVFSQFGFLGGMLAAWLHIRYWRGEPPFRRKGPKPPTPPKRHLRSVN
jgi:membrane associated rhomboid family serine protease